jgi:hypothetical protein
MTKWKKGQIGYYRGAMQGNGSGPVIQAIVRHVHRDGTVTVEAQWRVGNEGQGGCYLGYKYRFNADRLFAVKPLSNTH